jgi:hypothetical protein
MDTKCPLTGDPCWEHGCAWYIQVQGTHPQTGTTVSEWGCAVAWLPVLLIENANQARQTGAAVESFRNEMAKGAEGLLQLARQSNPKRLNSEH